MCQDVGMIGNARTGTPRESFLPPSRPTVTLLLLCVTGRGPATTPPSPPAYSGVCGHRTALSGASGSLED